MSRLGFAVPPASGGIPLGQSAVAASNTGGTTETTLATITIPAGAMGANGRIEVRALFSVTNSANTKTLRVRFGGTTFASSAVTAVGSAPLLMNVANRNAANSQVGTLGTGFGTASGAAITTAIDTTAAVNITITGQLGLGTEAITLESYQVLLYPKG